MTVSLDKNKKQPRRLGSARLGAARRGANNSAARREKNRAARPLHAFCAQSDLHAFPSGARLFILFYLFFFCEQSEHICFVNVVNSNLASARRAKASIRYRLVPCVRERSEPHTPRVD